MLEGVGGGGGWEARGGLNPLLGLFGLAIKWNRPSVTIQSVFQNPVT